MNRFRIFVTVVLSVVLLAAAAPALEARPLGKPQVAVQSIGGEWLSAAWSWLAQALRIEPAVPMARQEKAKPDSGTTSDGGFNVRPTAGSCIDPNGCTWGG